MIHTQFVGTFMLYLDTEFHISGSSCSLFIADKVKSKWKFWHGRHVFVLH